MFNLELQELKVKIMKKEHDVEQARLDQGRAQVRIEALQKDIDRHAEEITNMKAEYERLSK